MKPKYYIVIEEKKDNTFYTPSGFLSKELLIAIMKRMSWKFRYCKGSDDWSIYENNKYIGYLTKH